jgi:type II secretory pathway component GspD/PulD (secretin)
MSKITKNNFVVGVVLLALCNLAAGADPQKADAQEKVENPYQGARVLIEALLVEVKLEAMENAGVGLLSEKPASAAKILEIIRDKNTGRIQTCQKLALVSPGSGVMKTSGQISVPFSQDPNAKAADWVKYDIGSSINANLEIDPDGRIFISFKMDVRTLGNDLKAENQPPDVLSCTWDSTVSLKSGTPIIAGGLEGKGKMTYLILRADIEQDSLPQSAKHKK